MLVYYDCMWLDCSQRYVAMENAMEEARAAEDYITADVRKCGVAQAIDRFVFGK